MAVECPYCGKPLAEAHSACCGEVGHGVVRDASHSTDRIRHASLTSLNHSRLCGGVGRITQPGETVNCPACRATLNHLRQQYPARFDYEDIRPTKAQARQAARDMAADMMGGADD